MIWLRIDPEELIMTIPLTEAQHTTNEPTTGCDQENVLAALQNKQITAEQAMWLSNHNINWEITA